MDGVQFSWGIVVKLELGFVAYSLPSPSINCQTPANPRNDQLFSSKLVCQYGLSAPPACVIENVVTLGTTTLILGVVAMRSGPGVPPPPKGSFLPLFNPTLRLSDGIKLQCNHPPRDRTFGDVIT